MGAHDTQRDMIDAIDSGCDFRRELAEFVQNEHNCVMAHAAKAKFVDPCAIRRAIRGEGYSPALLKRMGYRMAPVKLEV